MSEEEEEPDLAVEIWSLFNQLECRISQLSLAVSDHRTINASYRLREARMWLEQLECDEFEMRKEEKEDEYNDCYDEYDDIPF